MGKGERLETESERKKKILEWEKLQRFDKIGKIREAEKWRNSKK